MIDWNREKEWIRHGGWCLMIINALMVASLFLPDSTPGYAYYVLFGCIIAIGTVGIVKLRRHRMME